MYADSEESGARWASNQRLGRRPGADGRRSRETKGLGAGSDLDEKAGGAEVEGRFRRALGRQDDPGAPDGGAGLVGQNNRLRASLIGPLLGRARFGLRGRLVRLTRTAFTRGIRDGEATSGRGERRPERSRFGTRRVTAAGRHGARGAASTSQLARCPRRTGRCFARHRQHPHDRREGDPTEPEVTTETGHRNPTKRLPSLPLTRLYPPGRA